MSVDLHACLHPIQAKAVFKDAGALRGDMVAEAEKMSRCCRIGLLRVILQWGALCFFRPLSRASSKCHPYFIREFLCEIVEGAGQNSHASQVATVTRDSDGHQCEKKHQCNSATHKREQRFCSNNAFA
jgi:hypothetical protein